MTKRQISSVRNTETARQKKSTQSITRTLEDGGHSEAIF